MNSEIGRIKSREKKIDALMNLAKKHEAALKMFEDAGYSI